MSESSKIVFNGSKGLWSNLENAVIVSTSKIMI